MNRYNTQGINYVVRNGDSIYSLSRRYNVGIAEISRENPLIDIYNLNVGDEIRIPVEIGIQIQVVEYMVENHETIQNVLTKFGIEFEELLKYNDLNTLKLKQGMMLNIPMKNYTHKTM